MKLLCYGEDGLTLHAITNRVDTLFKELGESEKPENCHILYRPSFGRGTNCFGEFDAIIIAKDTVYLIESKWMESNGEVKSTNLVDAQLLRHEVIKSYIELWYKHFMQNGSYPCHLNELDQSAIPKKIPGDKSLLYKHILAILGLIADVCGDNMPRVKNILLVFCNNPNLKGDIQCHVPTGFELSFMDYDSNRLDVTDKHYIAINYPCLRSI
ncbi:MAG: hypothetical protein PHY48_10330 [Candidatus Cloacimonetes bacterium]|nr:hypothetical protein [Candidatus Cloacimonadota bacterium]